MARLAEVVGINGAPKNRLKGPTWLRRESEEARGSIDRAFDFRGLFPGAVYLFVDRASRDSARKAFANVRGCLDLSKRPLKCARSPCPHARLFASVGPTVNSDPSFGQVFSVGAGGPKWGANTTGGRRSAVGVGGGGKGVISSAMLVAMLAANWLTMPSSAAMRTESPKLEDVCTVGGEKCTEGVPEYAGDMPIGVAGGRAYVCYWGKQLIRDGASRSGVITSQNQARIFGGRFGGIVNSIRFRTRNLCLT
ncbi:hypothetical protein CRG98_010743 [Punica granatum]|uniref:Uncharacterized protein n=1 Tax=Punica granatum TaxID=22663 RepID=A0A2I0KK63_PUNGR|nr:hypothetical protein CRG98_010743 [Punica granatum]